MPENRRSWHTQREDGFWCTCRCSLAIRARKWEVRTDCRYAGKWPGIKAAPGTGACSPCRGHQQSYGSCFTSDEISVSRFCRELRRQAPDFLVLDSLTLDTSVLYEQAQKQEFRAFRRDVFLDDIAERKAVLRELDKAAVLARRNGMAVAIGHPYPETLAALAVWKGYSRPDLKVGDFPDVGQP